MQKNYDTLAKKSSQEVADFFGMDFIPIGVVVHNSWKSLAGSMVKDTKYTGAPEWLTGFAGEKTIHLLGPEAMPKGHEGSRKERFEKTIVHEMSHIYYRKFKGNGAPKWLNEGTAIYIAKQKGYKKPEKVTTQMLNEYHGEIKEGIYTVGAYVVKEIIKDYGKEKLLGLINLKSENTAEDRYVELQKMFSWLK